MTTEATTSRGDMTNEALGTVTKTDEPLASPDPDGEAAADSSATSPPSEPPLNVAGQVASIEATVRRLFERVSVLDLVGLAIGIACSLFVLGQMRPDLLFSDTTPSGGDMGAHVWGPAFLRDHLLSEGRLSGWTPDWYAGFPAYQFYMVVPSLAIVAINAGLRPMFGIPVVIIGMVITYILTQGSDRKFKIRLLVGLALLLLLAVPYGIAFKLVSVSGLVTFPLSAWAMGRLARAPDPIPALLPIGALFFLFDTNFTIYGGNIASTLAGEFAFSISLSLCLLAFGVAARGMDNGRWRAPAAIIIALVALTHIIPVFFLVVGLIALVVMGPNVPRLWPVAAAVALALVPVALADGTSTLATVMAVAAAVVVLGAVTAAESVVFSRSIWLVVTGITGFLLSCFWLLPFVLREPFFNDMGWERLDDVGAPMLTVPMKVALPVAALGAIGAIALRDRIGLLFATTGLVGAAAVANLGEGPLWNARLLPFYYLSVYLLAAVGIAFVVRFAATAISEDFALPDRRVLIGASALALLGGLVAVSMPLRILPGGTEQADGTYTWMKLTSHAKSFLPSWTAWNYSGYEEKPAYREYRSVVMAMDQVGEVNGCGRAMWEYDKELDRYGTPMALMLLPHWTDGCIGSMEGLYFESSATTPFHFLNQSMLSQNPSRAQRDLPYQDFDITRGIAQLQVMGVRYYMAQEDASIAAARFHPDLTEVGEAQPFVIFEVDNSSLVEGLPSMPVVVEGQGEEEAGEIAGRFDIGWLGEAVSYYNDPGSFQALPAEDGPAEWQRVEALLPSDGQQIEPAVISDLTVETSSISFSVDEVGRPVLVKASYFPNWNVDGADGPWRIGPNLMVVVPTANEVELSYGRTALDLLGILATLIGGGIMFAAYSADRRKWSAAQQVEVWGVSDDTWEGELDGLRDAALAPEVAPDRSAPTAGAPIPGINGSDVTDVAAGVSATAVATPDVVAPTPERAVEAAPDVATPDVVAPGSDAAGASNEGTEADDSAAGSSPAMDIETNLSTEIGRREPPSS